MSNITINNDGSMSAALWAVIDIERRAICDWNGHLCVFATKAEALVARTAWQDNRRYQIIAMQPEWEFVP
jgi:hypothetical protein